MTRAALLLGALLLAGPAEAQCLGFQCPPGVLGGGTSGVTAPLDAFTQPAAAYSMRRLKSTYSGPAIRLRRASDNAEADIGFLGFTSFTGAPIDTAAANAHCAATTCFIRTWYDQSGNARHATQTTAGNQPQFIFSCTGTLPCARSTLGAAQKVVTAGTVVPASPMTWSAVANRNSGADVCVMGYFFFNQLYTQSGFPAWVIQGTGSQNANAADAAWHAAVGVIGAGAALRVDDIENAGTVTASVGTPDIFHIAVGAPATTCSFAETVLWNGYALTASERAALVSNQRSFWGIP